MYDTSLPLPEISPSAFVIGPLRDHTGFRLTGEADFTVRDRLRAALTALAADGAREIHLDLAGLSFIDVCCARELIALTERYPAARLVVYCPPASMRLITAILHPEATIEFIDTPRRAAREADGRSEQVTSHWLTLATREGPLAPDIVELISAEHVRIRNLIGKLDAFRLDAALAGPAPEAGLTWAALAGFLRFHVDAAEEIAYLPLAGATPEAAAAIVRAAEADADIRAAVGETQLSRPGSPTWQLAVQAACSAARSHIACVESDPLLHFQHRTALKVRRTLGRQWVAFMAARALDESAR